MEIGKTWNFSNGKWGYGNREEDTFEPVSTQITMPGTQTSTTTPISPSGPRPEFKYKPKLSELPELAMPTMPELPKYTAPKAPTMPEYTAPKAPTMPTFKAPAWDEKAIASMAQKNAAPGVRGLKEGLREMTAKMGNDPISRHNSREAITGYGRGLSSVMAGAHSAAVQEYSQKYGYKFQEAAMNFEAEADAIGMKYQGDLSGRLAEYGAEVQGVMAKYQADISAENIQYQSAFQSMVAQYQIEAQSAMVQYETEANRSSLLAQLEQEAAVVDYNSLMQDYMSQYGQTTTTMQEPTVVTQGTGGSGTGGASGYGSSPNYTGGYTDEEFNWMKRNQPMDYRAGDWEKIGGKWQNTHQTQRTLEGELPGERRPSGIPLPIGMWGKV